MPLSIGVGLGVTFPHQTGGGSGLLPWAWATNNLNLGAFWRDDIPWPVTWAWVTGILNTRAVWLDMETW